METTSLIELEASRDRKTVFHFEFCHTRGIRGIVLIVTYLVI